jgi:hypothetical protein
MEKQSLSQSTNPQLPYEWSRLEDFELLKLRFKDLKLNLNTTPVRGWLKKFEDELALVGLKIRPHYYLGDEWFSPEGELAIAIPFFLSHPRLQALEQSQMLDCEGDTEEEFLKLLRHEMGHVFDHAFKVSRRTKWKRIFGSNKKPYDPENYRPRAYSKNFVHNIANDYAQAHPDEDFAETFAVWLNPKSNWRQRYKNWGAIRKLEYVDELAQEFANQEAATKTKNYPYDATRLTSTLGRYYARRKKRLAFESPSFFDEDLKRIFFKPDSESGKTETAFRMMQKNKKEMTAQLAFWSREKKYVVEQLYQRIQRRLRELELRAPQDSRSIPIELTAWLTSVLINYRLGGKWSRRLS